MRHVVFAAFLVLFVLIGGQNWHHYAAALMLAAWARHGGRLNTRLF